MGVEDKMSTPTTPEGHSVGDWTRDEEIRGHGPNLVFLPTSLGQHRPKPTRETTTG